MNPSDAEHADFFAVEGNAECPTGYKGRCGIFEIFVMNEELESMIYKGATLVELRAKAIELLMRNMREDGIRKITSGITTIDEVLKVTI